MSSDETKGSAFWQSVSISVGLLWLTVYQAYESVAVLFRDRSATRSYGHEKRNRLGHAFCDQFSIYQLRSLFHPSGVAVRQACQECGVPWMDEVIPKAPGAKIHWVGNIDAKSLILYLHGGGYGLPTDGSHAKFLIECQTRLAKHGQRTAVAVLEYSLTPESRYPTQPKQALEALQLVIDKGFHPSNITIGGDSAGGNLALAVLSLIAHPTPPFPTVKLDAPLRGAFLISPWVSFSAQSQSYRDCAARDVVLPRQMYEWADAYAPSPIRNEYSEPIRADVAWWTNIPVRDVLILVGAIEIFRDDIQEIGKRIWEAGVPTTTVTCPSHVHVECLLDAKAGLAPGVMAETIWEWLRSQSE